jgi:hypothetical protein
MIAQIALGFGVPVIAIAVWAVFGAPRSTRRLRGVWLLLLRLVFFGAGAAALYAAGHHTLGLAFAVVATDAHFGEIPTFLDAIDALGKWYRSEAPCETRVWMHTLTVEPPGGGGLGRPRPQPRVSHGAPKPRELRALAAALPQTAWTRALVKEGSQGPLVYDFAFLRVTTLRAGLPGPRVWAIFRRKRGKDPEFKFYLSHAPATCRHAEFVRVSGLRGPVETALEEAQGEVGPAHYETRGWVSWHHHIAHAFRAHLFLVRLCLVFKKSPAMTVAQARRLIARALDDEQEERPDILSIIAYHQERNYTAYRSHRRCRRGRKT